MKVFNVKHLAYTASTLVLLTTTAGASMSGDDNNDGQNTPQRRRIDMENSDNDENDLPQTPNINGAILTPGAPRKPILTPAQRQAFLNARDLYNQAEAARALLRRAQQAEFRDGETED
jgi:hypothetical protein